MNAMLGCKPSPPDRRDLLLAKYVDLKALRIAMDQAPGATDWSEATRPDGRRVQPVRSALGNDIAGNCVLAGPAHQEIVIGQITGREVGITADDVLDEYADCTGYNRVTGEGDNGWYIRDMLKTSMKRAMFGGKMEPSAAFVLVNHENIEERVLASWLGVGTIDGCHLPLAAQGQRDDRGRDLWYVPPGGWPAGKGPGTWGGHCMWKLAVSPWIDKYWSWGDPAWARDDWTLECTFECWLRITKSALMRNGRIPAGFAWDDLMADVAARAQG